MYHSSLKFFIERRPFDSGGVALYVSTRAGVNGRASTARALPIQFKALENEKEEMSIPAPCLMADAEDMQQLMDELWRSGFRPTEGTGSAGSLAATERHLADMRHLVFKTKPSA